MNTTAAPALIIDGDIIEVTPDPIHEYTLTTAQVADSVIAALSGARMSPMTATAPAP